MGRKAWAVSQGSDGWIAKQWSIDPKTGMPAEFTGERLGPFPTRPDLEAALLKAGVSFSDLIED